MGLHSTDVHHPNTQYTALPPNIPPAHTVHQRNTQYTAYHTVNCPPVRSEHTNTAFKYITQPYHTVQSPNMQYTTQTLNAPPPPQYTAIPKQYTALPHSLAGGR